MIKSVNGEMRRIKSDLAEGFFLVDMVHTYKVFLSVFYAIRDVKHP